MRVAILLVLSVSLIGCTVQFNPGAGEHTQARGGTDSERVAVRTAASAVLAQLDAEQWEKVWSAGGTSLKQTSNQWAFATGVRSSHAMFGALKSRTITGYAFPESLEGAPQGNTASCSTHPTSRKSRASRNKSYSSMSAASGAWLATGPRNTSKSSCCRSFLQVHPPHPCPFCPWPLSAGRGVQAVTGGGRPH
jgi:hypothetical protein